MIPATEYCIGRYSSAIALSRAAPFRATFERDGGRASSGCADQTQFRGSSDVGSRGPRPKIFRDHIQADIANCHSRGGVVQPACRDAGRYDEAIRNCKKILEKEPNYLFAHTCLASSYALMGRDEEAHAEAAEVLRINPNFSVDYLVGRAPYKYEVDKKRLRDSLLKAGLPH